MPNGDSGYAGTRPKLGLSPTLPQNAAGMRTEPAPSVPTLSGPSPAATAAAVPPDEPPGVFVGSHGLRVSPVRSELVSPLQPNSGVVVLPSRIAPASRSRAVAGASTSHGWSGSTVWLPRRVGQPFVRMRSLIVVGTPSSGPTGSPRCQRISLAAAAAIASSAARWANALIVGLTASMRSSTARVASTGEADPSAYIASSSVAVHWVRSRHAGHLAQTETSDALASRSVNGNAAHRRVGCTVTYSGASVRDAGRPSMEVAFFSARYATRPSGPRWSAHSTSFERWPWNVVQRHGVAAAVADPLGVHDHDGAGAAALVEAAGDARVVDADDLTAAVHAHDPRRPVERAPHQRDALVLARRGRRSRRRCR